MDWRVTLVSLVALIGLASYVLVFDTESASERAELEASSSNVFAGLDTDSIERLSLRTTDGIDAQLERTDGVWRLTRPVTAEADPTAVDRLVAALGSLESDAVYEEIETLGSYGLDVEASVRFSSAGVEHALLLGGTAPVGSGRYATDESGLKVWLVPAGRTNAFAKSLHQLREARLLLVDPAKVHSLAVRWPGGEVVLRRGEDGDSGWQLQRPLAVQARAQTVESLLSDLTFVRASAFVDDPTDAEQSAFDSPAYRVEIGQSEGVAPLLFEVAAADAAGRSLVRGPGGGIAEVPKVEIQDFPRTVSAFRFREVARFVPSEVRRFSISFAGETRPGVEGTRTETGGWAFAEGALEPGAASRLLSALSQLEAAEIAADSMGSVELAGLGLAPGRTRIQIFGEAGSLAELTLGVIRGDGAIAARSAASEIVYWLDAAVAEAVPVGRAAFDEAFQASVEKPGEEAAGEAIR